VTRALTSVLSRPCSTTLWLPLLGALCLLLAGCGDGDGGTGPTIRHAQDVLPSDVSGWELEGAIRTGTTDAELQAVINGGYTVYTRHGMKEFAFADYVGSGSQAGAFMHIDIYRMNSADGAADLYSDSDLYAGTPEENPEIGDAARLYAALPVGKTLEFVRDDYYVLVVITQASSTDEARIQVEFIAGNIDQEIVQ
jgi:hypothetical protein